MFPPLHIATLFPSGIAIQPVPLAINVRPVSAPKPEHVELSSTCILTE